VSIVISITVEGGGVFKGGSWNSGCDFILCLLLILFGTKLEFYFPAPFVESICASGAVVCLVDYLFEFPYPNVEGAFIFLYNDV
jgi:hypothetical protein